MPEPSRLEEPEQNGRVSSSKARYLVLFFVCSLSMITYLDRVCFGVAAPQIAASLNLATVADLKWAFTAFSIAYAIFEVPTGWLGDRLGPRSMITRIVLWWSACTALTGLVGVKYAGWTFGGLGTLILLRFLFGAGEAGAYPNISRVIYNWFPQQQWEMAQGYVWMSGRLMGGITPFLWALLVTGTGDISPQLSWRGAFLIFGIIGVIWCILFRSFFQNFPASSEAEELSLSRANLHSHENVPWKWLLFHREFILLCLSYSLLNYGWAFNITYLPAYLQQRFPGAASPVLVAVYAGAPLWIGAIGCLSGGYCVSWINRFVKNRQRSRKLLGMSAMLGCALCWAVASIANSIHVVSGSVALAAFCVDLTLGSAWAACQDIGQKHTAVAAAVMNTVGTVGAAFAVWLTGTVVQQAVAQRAILENLTVSTLSDSARNSAAIQGFQYVFMTYLCVYLAAALCWLLMRTSPAKKLD